MEPRISSKDAQAMMNAYAKVYAPPEEPKVENQTEEEPFEEMEDLEAKHYEENDDQIYRTINDE